ncbi:MAG: hypothetical protein DCO96_05555 [Fluviicola sp. XM-24bin1]|nr:MAG: hypothetical protein DCO96_05555 [Fluviicola sp. XM-24bin1]
MKGALLLLILTLSLGSIAQDNGRKISKERENALTKIYFKALNRHRKGGNYDSAIYYNNKLIDVKSTESRKIMVIFQKMDTYLMFNRTASAYKLGISTLLQERRITAFRKQTSMAL